MTTTSPLVTAPSSDLSASRSGDRARLERLGDLSVKRAIEPDTAFAWGTLGAGAVLPDDLLSVAGLDVELDADTRARLSRAEVASMLAAGIRFEAVLNGILSTWIGEARRLDDPRFVYMLHEVAEETKHQRAFLRLIDELDATVPNPLERGPAVWLRRRTVRIARRERAFFAVLLLAGEEVPDHLQMLATEHPDTDPLLAAVNRYHRAEEARHLSFARMLLRDHWSSASARERRRIRFAAPFVIRGLFESMVHPGVYRSVGLPAFATWRAAHRTPQRLAMRYAATRPILRELVAVGAMTPGRIPRGWRRLCGVDASGCAVGA